MEHSNHSEHQQDGMGHDMHEGHRNTGPKDGDHTGHHVGMATDFRKRFWICLIVTVPVLALTYDSISKIPQRTQEDKLDAQVAAGKRVWQRHNGNDCHTILGGYHG